MPPVGATWEAENIGGRSSIFVVEKSDASGLQIKETKGLGDLDSVTWHYRNDLLQLDHFSALHSFPSQDWQVYLTSGDPVLLWLLAIGNKNRYVFVMKDGELWASITVDDYVSGRGTIEVAGKSINVFFIEETKLTHRGVQTTVPDSTYKSTFFYSPVLGIIIADKGKDNLFAIRKDVRALPDWVLAGER